MKAKTLCSLFVAVMMLAVAPLELFAKTLGMVADFPTTSVTVFDADTHTVLGTVPINPDTVGDVLITPDLKRGFATNFRFEVFVIDLTTSPPSLAGGTNPIPISNFGEDLSISPDGKFLVVTGSDSFQPISIIDVAAQAEIGTFSTGSDTNSVDVCSDGSVLVTSFQSFTLRRLTIDGTGSLTDTGEVLSLMSDPLRDPTNVYCAPGAASGVVITFGASGGGEVTSFSIPGLAKVDNRSLSGLEGGISGTIHPSGNRVFVRSRSDSFGLMDVIDVFDFNPTTGALGAGPLLTIPIAGALNFFGIDQIALHPNGGKLYVSEPGAVNVYDPSTGAFIAAITDPAIVNPNGVTVVTEADPCALPPPTGAIVGTNGPDILNGTPFGDTIFGLGGPDIVNGRGGNDLICGGTGSDLITGGAGNDTLNTQDGVSGNDSASGGAGNDVCTGDPGDALSGCNP